MTLPRPWIHRVDDAFDGVDRVCYESDTTWALLPVSLALAFSYVAFDALHHSSLALTPGLVMDGIAAVSSIAALCVSAAAWRHRVPDHLSHAAMTLLVAITTVNARPRTPPRSCRTGAASRCAAASWSRSPDAAARSCTARSSTSTGSRRSTTNAAMTRGTG